jgi:uncharacterized membrane protein YhiD involved in acid resistance
MRPSPVVGRACIAACSAAADAPHDARGLSSAALILFTASLGITVAASSPVLALLALLLALVTLSDRPFHRSQRPGGPEGGP